MKYKKIFIKIGVFFCLIVSIFIGVNILKNVNISSNIENASSESSSIIYFINIDTLERAEIRIDYIEDRSNPLAIYVPFKISADNIRYDKETIILGVKQYDTYSIITIFSTDYTGNIFLEVLNNNGEMYSGVSLNGSTENGLRNVKLCIPKDGLDNGIIRKNLTYIKYHYVNISTEVEITNTYGTDKTYSKLPANENCELFLEKENYIFNYSIDGYVNEEREDSSIVLIQTLLFPILIAAIIGIYNMFKHNEEVEKIPKGELIGGIIVFLFSIGCIVYGIVEKINILYIIIILVLEGLILFGYVVIRINVIKKIVEKLKH